MRPTLLHNPSAATVGRIKALLFVLCLLPLAASLWQALSGQAVNPVETLTRDSGSWALNLLLAGLAITPLRRLGTPGWLLRLRRMLGLYAFFYASVHLLIYLWLDQLFDWAAIVQDIIKRPFITVGMVAFALLLPLAITSTDGWLRRLKRRWGQLHRLVYPLALLAVLHYLWLVKRDLTEPLLYAAVLAVLLGLRMWWRLRPTSGPRVQ